MNQDVKTRTEVILKVAKQEDGNWHVSAEFSKLDLHIIADKDIPPKVLKYLDGRKRGYFFAIPVFAESLPFPYKVKRQAPWQPW